MVIPEVVISDGSSTTLAMNPTYGYPLKLDGSLCFPEELSKCIDDPTLDKKCCEQLYDENSWPEETVTVLEEFLIIFFCVLTVAIIRLQLWKVTTQRSGFEYCQKYWALILWDTLFGAFLAFEYSFFLTNFLKVSVSAPRPLYYAAKIYGSVHSDHRKPFRGVVYSHFLPHSPPPLLRRCDQILPLWTHSNLHVDPWIPYVPHSGGCLSPLQDLLLELQRHRSDASVRPRPAIHRSLDIR
jgi:hypothetical protein